MGSKGHESLGSYTDHFKVKISERYKPPPRINTVMTGAQRLSLYKQTQDNIPTYEFSLEKTALNKMREWRSIRAVAVQERQGKLVKIRQEMGKKEKERIEQEQLEEEEVKTVNETVPVRNVNNNFDGSPATLPFKSSTSSNLPYSTNSNILMPTQAPSNYSSILMPIPLHDHGSKLLTKKKNDKSPFNISDFESDTSSPFDNMELKSINDMEELAQVLNRGEKDEAGTSIYPVYQNLQPSVHADLSQPQTEYVHYMGNQTSYIPNTVAYNTPANSNYCYTNGYYYPEIARANPAVFSPAYYSNREGADYNYTSIFQKSTADELKKSSCKSVPDIVSALETELENIQFSSKHNNSVSSNSNSPTARPKSTDAVYSASKKGEETDDAFSRLSKNDQHLCKRISSMGFPILRVSRICSLLGSDQKKIVEHLLALTDLLDLGFPEEDVSSALIENDNDRDKALDKLIL